MKLICRIKTGTVAPNCSAWARTSLRIWRRAKLYYLRDLTGKKARIADRDRGDEADQYAIVEEATVVEVSSDETSVNV
jgi:hypothetical protein